MNPNVHATPDTASRAAITGSSLIDDLQPIVPLILDLDLRDEILATFDGPTRLAAEGIFQCAARLTSMTQWSEQRLLEVLGCTIKTVGDFKVELDGLNRCGDFLALVTLDAGLVDTHFDRRQLVVEYARLLKATGADAEALKASLKVEVDSYTAVDYIRLGEIEAAVEQTRIVHGLDEVDTTEAGNDPFEDTDTVHLSPNRIDMLIEGKRSALGHEVANYMNAHIDKCPGCAAAFEYRKSHLIHAA
jgi:hypothetical protein